MINKEIIDFIRKEKNKGTSLDMMRQELLSGGWKEADIQEAFTTESQTMPTGNTVNALPIHKNKNPKTFFVVIILLILIGVGITYAYQKGFFQSSPETIVKNAFENARNAKSSTFDVTFSMSSDSIITPDITPKTSSLTLKGSYAFNEKNEFTSNAHASIEFAHISLGGDLRYVDNKLHIFVDNLGLLANNPFTSNLKERWFYIEKKNSTDIEKMVLPFSGALGLSPKVFEDLTPEQKEHVLEITDKASFITIKEKLGTETIQDIPTNHFSFVLDQESIGLYADTLEAYIHEIGKNDSYLSTFSMKGIKQKLTEMKNFAGELWIGKKDQLPYKVSISFTIEKEKSSGEKIFSVPINTVFIFKDWNQPVNIVAPEGSVSFKELGEQMKNNIVPSKEESEESAESLLGEEAFENANKKKEDADNKAGVQVISAKMYSYNKDNNDSFEGGCDSKTLTTIANTIKARPLGYTYLCNDSPTKWVVSVKLNTDKWWCGDSVAYPSEIITTPKEYSCL